MSKISVIVPVYKVEPYLHRCVDSILGQTFSDFELVLVDDGSPDNCGAICDEYAAKDSRVHVIHQQNGGLSAARNAGIDWAFVHSDSQWLSFIDSDDWIHSKTFELLIHAAESNHVRVSVCGFCKPSEMMMPELTESDQAVSLTTPEAFWCASYVNATVAWGKLYRKELFQEIRYPVGKIHEDEFTTYRILFAEQKIAVLSAPLYCYFQNQASIMRSKWSLAHLSTLDAYELQTAYYAQNGFAEAYQFNLRQYLFWCRYKMAFLEPQLSDTMLRKGYDTIRKRLARFLLHHRKDLSSKKYREYYELAFPRYFRLYHLGGKLLGRHR